MCPIGAIVGLTGRPVKGRDTIEMSQTWPCRTRWQYLAMNAAPLPRNILRNLPARLGSAVDEARSAASEFGVEAHLVGGPVRDLLLGREVVDLDLMVVGDGVTFAHALAERLGGAVVGESQFGTAKVEASGVAIDVASARRERYERPGALPSVAPGSVDDDLARRDFTVNAMAVALYEREFGLLLDPCGGRRDMAARLLRSLHDASFQDDATRMLRGVRYAVRLGFAFEPGTAALVRSGAGFLDAISGDRLRNELYKMLGEPDPAACLRLAGELGLLRTMHAALADQNAIAGNAAKAGIAGSEAAMAAAMAWGLSPEEAKSLASRLRLRSADAAVMEDVARIAELRPALTREGLRPSEAVRLLDGQSAEALQVVAALTDDAQVERLVRIYLEEWRYAQPLLTGDDLQELGASPGPRMGELLRGLRDARLDGEVSTRKDEVEWVVGRVEGDRSP